MVKKNITIDKLAVMVQKGFENTATKQRLDDLQNWSEGKFVKIEKDLKDIKRQLTDIVYRSEFDELKNRVKDLENLLAFNNKKR